MVHGVNLHGVHLRAYALSTARAGLVLSLVAGCGPSLDRPPMTPAPVSAFVEVPYPPPRRAPR